MKKISILFMTMIAALAITSCEDTNSEDINLNVNNTGELKLAIAGGTYVVTETNGGDLADVLSWNIATTDVPVQITYTVQMDSQGGDFSTPFVLGATGNTSLALSYDDLNEAAATGFSADAGVAGNYDVRVIAALADPAIAPVVSNVVTVTITPFELYPFKDLYLVGNATAADWNNDNNNPALYRDAVNENVYHYSGRFLANEFKLLSTPGFWQPQYGPRNGAVGVNDGAGSDPATFVIPATGYYNFTVDVTGVTNASEGSSSFTLVANPNGATATTYTSMAIIGEATPNGWNDPDTNMVQSTFDPHQWSLRNVTLTTGEMKIRANDDWSNSWGDNVSNYSGKGNNNNDPNMSVKAGVYNIFFNDLDGRFILIPVQ
ncbi:MAG: SusF/SusE family outer membrane protein [Nonlabens sp.]|nr:SusF/SusE family outer membrane protein [Nonlabens sp.]